MVGPNQRYQFELKPPLGGFFFCATCIRDVCLWHETDMATAMRDVRSRGQSGKHLLAARISPFDPNVWSGRALQEVFVDLVVSGLASMYPVSSWSCFAPDHHGYQRACVLILAS